VSFLDEEEWANYPTVSSGSDSLEIGDLADAVRSIYGNTGGFGLNPGMIAASLARKLGFKNARYMTEDLDPNQSGGFKKDAQGNWITSDRPAGDTVMLGNFPIGRPIPRSDANRPEVNMDIRNRIKKLKMRQAMFMKQGNMNAALSLQPLIDKLQFIS
jgi:hypothetical protein